MNEQNEDKPHLGTLEIAQREEIEKPSEQEVKDIIRGENGIPTILKNGGEKIINRLPSPL